MERAAKKVTILIIEDESIVALDMRGRLLELGYEVVGIASSGRTALALAEREKPDLVLMDIKLQGDLDGVETAELMRRFLDSPVIFITAFADQKTLERAKITQAFGYIVKPFQDREVLISIEMALYKHRLERDLRDSRELLQGSLDAIVDGIIALDGQDRVVFMNSNAEVLLDVSSGTAQGQALDEFCTFSEVGALSEFAASYRGAYPPTGAEREFRWVMMAAPSGKRPMEINWSPLRDADGGRSGRVLALRDISDLVAAESTRTRLSSIVAHSHDAIYSLDSNLKVLSWNLGAELIFGYSAVEMVGSTIERLVPEDKDRTQLRDLVAFAATGKEFGRFETTRRCRSGKIIAVSVSFSPLRDAEGKVVEIACIERDVSAEKEYEGTLITARKTAEEMNRVKSEFLSNMSHELRTPLNSIIGMVELAKEEAPSDSQREYLEIARQSADNLLFLINSILDFSKIEVGKMRLHPVVFDPVDAVEDCLEELSVQAYRKGLSLLFRGAPEVPAGVYGDPRRFKQILTNMLSNGIKFTESGSVRVDLDCLVAEGEGSVMLKLSVTDTGIGIPMDKLPSVWHSFTQLDGSSTRAYGGTGLGLSIVKSLAELMGGGVSVESRVGKGSVFTASVPFQVSGDDRSAAPGPRVPAGSAVLIAMASAEERAIYKELFESWGCRVSMLGSAAETIAALQGSKGAGFRLVVLEENIPDRGALFSCAMDHGCRECLKDRLVVVTPLGTRDNPGWRELSSTTRFLFKPLRRRQLMEVLERGTGHGLEAQHPNPGTQPAMSAPAPAYPAAPAGKPRAGAAKGSPAVFEGPVRETLDAFIDKSASFGIVDFIHIEGAASEARKACDILGAVDASRALFKIVLACRREDAPAVRDEIDRLRAAEAAQSRRVL